MLQNPSAQFSPRPASLGGMQDNLQFEVHVKHIAGGSGGVAWYCATMQEALESLQSWKAVVEVHVTPVAK